MNNPYSPTTADLSVPGGSDTPYQPKIFAMEGRIGRLRYLAYMMGVSILLMFAIAIPLMILAAILGLGEIGRTILLGVAYIPVVVFCFALAVRRLNDMNKSGWLSLLNLIPIVNIFVGLWLLCGPGDQGGNQYGPPPVANSGGVIAACIVPLVLFVLMGIMLASIVPLFMGMLK